jgi:hypothetical protein
MSVYTPKEPVLHLYCTWAIMLDMNILVYKSIVMHLYGSVYKSLCCTCTCASVPHLDVSSVFKSLCCTCMGLLSKSFCAVLRHLCIQELALHLLEPFDFIQGHLICKDLNF